MNFFTNIQKMHSTFNGRYLKICYLSQILIEFLPSDLEKCPGEKVWVGASVYAMKVYKGSKDRGQLILNFGTNWT